MQWWSRIDSTEGAEADLFYFFRNSETCCIDVSEHVQNHNQHKSEHLIMGEEKRPILHVDSIVHKIQVVQIQSVVQVANPK